MPSFTGASVALFAAIVAMTHVAAIRDSYDEFGRLSASEDQEQEQDYQKVGSKVTVNMPLKSTTEINQKGVWHARPGASISPSRTLNFKDYGIEIGVSMRVVVVKTAQHVGLGWKLVSVAGTPVETLKDADDGISSMQGELADGEEKIVALGFDTSEAITDAKAMELREVGMELTEKFNMNKPEFNKKHDSDQELLGLRDFGVTLMASGTVLTIGGEAERQGVGGKGGTPWILKYVGKKKVRNAMDIYYTINALKSNLTPGEKTTLQLTFLVVDGSAEAPSSHDGAGTSHERRGAMNKDAKPPQRGKFRDVDMYLSDTEDIKESGDRDTDGFKVFFFGMTIGADRKVEEIDYRSSDSTTARKCGVQAGWTLEAVDGQEVWSAEEISRKLMTLYGEMKADRQIIVQLKFCTGVCKKESKFKDLRHWAIKVAGPEDLFVAVQDQGKWVEGKIDVIETVDGVTGTMTIKPNDEKKRPITVQMPGDALRIKFRHSEKHKDKPVVLTRQHQREEATQATWKASKERALSDLNVLCYPDDGQPIRQDAGPISASILSAYHSGVLTPDELKGYVGVLEGLDAPTAEDVRKTMLTEGKK